MKYVNRVGRHFVLTYEKLWRVPLIDRFLIIELYNLISKNQKPYFVFFLIISILKLKCMCNFNAQWHHFIKLLIDTEK